MLRRGEMVIDDEWTDPDALFNPLIDGERKARGGVPRDYSVQPPDAFRALPGGIPLIPKTEWSARCKEQAEQYARLSDLRLSGMPDGTMVKGLDQGQVGYCWGHSTTHTVMLDRMVRGQPLIPLSAYAVCAIIKRGKDEGGWCGLSAQFMRDVGIPSQALWPQGKRDLSLDTPQMRADARKHRIVEDWVDLAKNPYDQNLTFDQVASLLLSGIPCAVDFNWWGHSVCALDLVEVEAGSFGIRIWNSWSESWGDRGMGVLRGGKAIPDGAVATCATLMSA